MKEKKITERTNDGLLASINMGRYPVGGILPLAYRGKDKKYILMKKIEK